MLVCDVTRVQVDGYVDPDPYADFQEPEFEFQGQSFEEPEQQSFGGKCTLTILNLFKEIVEIIYACLCQNGNPC